jgi:hypothetical protein
MAEAMYAEGAAERALARMQKECPEDYSRMLGLSLAMDKMPADRFPLAHASLNKELEAIFDKYVEAPVIPAAPDEPQFKFVRGARVRAR